MVAPTLISVDVSKPAWEQDPEKPLHNRWHPDIPAVASVKEGEVFKVECIDWTGGQIKNDDSADDVKGVDLSQVAPESTTSGPIAVETAEPGDLLKVEILDLGALETWGFTGTFHKDNGGGFLTDHYPEATKACWDFEGVYCKSRHIPGVKFAGLIHPGLIGTAPSKELLDMWNAREKQLQDELGTGKQKTLCSCLATPLACLPEPAGAPRQARPLQARREARVLGRRRRRGRADRARPRERRQLRHQEPEPRLRGLLPVFVPGANLSMGDMHFSQGDGEVSFCGAIEMSGWLELKCTVIKGGMKLLPAVGPSPLSVNPLFEIGPLEPRYSEYLVFEGICVDERGEQHFLDATLAYKRAVLNCIKYLAQFGYTEEQIYLLLSCCPCEGRLSGIVDVPNAVATLAVPLAIFDRDVRPSGTALEMLAAGLDRCVPCAP
ncbi:formamidase [Aureococcus anophagefferens]|nr:formamidase [Aureococcus anophagefferens]